MPKLISRFLASSSGKHRAHLITGIAVVLVAAVNWWLVVDEGPSPARIIAGIVASVAAVLELVLPNRRRLLRRRRPAPGPN
jgi:uncharacterized membrane protein